MDDNIKNVQLNHVMTVRELKEIVKDWPEQDCFGEPTEVWYMTGKNMSSPVHNITPLNRRKAEEIEWADLLLDSGRWD